MMKLNGTLSIVQTIFIVLKLVGVISWSWWWVLSPLWIPLVVLAIFLFVIYMIGKNNKTTMKKFKKQEIRDLLNQVYHEEISFSRMVEILNEMVSEVEEKCVEDIPKRKFKKGDKVRIKEGVSSKTHESVPPFFIPCMDNFIGTTMTIGGYINLKAGYVACEESGWGFHEEWLEPYVEELKKGDLAIFWDNEKEFAIIKPYGQSIGGEEDYFQHRDQNGFRWINAIKFESKEQFNRFIKGEI